MRILLIVLGPIAITRVKAHAVAISTKLSSNSIINTSLIAITDRWIWLRFWIIVFFLCTHKQNQNYVWYHKIVLVWRNWRHKIGFPEFFIGLSVHLMPIALKRQMLERQPSNMNVNGLSNIEQRRPIKTGNVAVLQESKFFAEASCEALRRNARTFRFLFVCDFFLHLFATKLTCISKSFDCSMSAWRFVVVLWMKLSAFDHFDALWVV